MIAGSDGAETRWVVASPENVVSTDLSGGTALLDLRTGQYFTLDGVGSLVWTLLQTPSSRTRIVDAILEEYEVAPDECDRDVEALLGELQGAALVETVAPAV